MEIMGRQCNQHGDLFPHVQCNYEVGQGMGRLKIYITKMKETLEACFGLLFLIFLDLYLSCDISMHALVV